jgi:hypothetical protein
MGCLRTSLPSCGVSAFCPDKFGCPPDACPDFQIKRNDTTPSLKVEVEGDDGPMDLTGLVLEASMWANAKLKKDIIVSDTVIQFADNIGFEQVLAGDIIVVNRVRSPEHMIILGFDEDAKTIQVGRGYNGTTPAAVKKGTVLRIFRFMSVPASTEMVYGDETGVDGCVTKDVLQASYLVYEWAANDTCVPGCFWLEFKLLKMIEGTVVVPSVIPLCYSGLGVEWVRRFPVCGELLVKICESPTIEI